MGDSTFEYCGVAPGRFALWENVLQDVGSARDFELGSRNPDEIQRLARQAIEQLWPHLEALSRLVDAANPYLVSIRRSIESSRQNQRNRRRGDISLDLIHAVDSVEQLLLGSPRRVEIPITSTVESWLAAATGCANLVPGPAATQTIRWQTPRAYLRPPQVRELAAIRIRDVSLEECRALVEKWNETSPVQRGLGGLEEERRGYGAIESRLREVFAGLQSDLRAFAARGDCYVGWTAWYGDE